MKPLTRERLKGTWATVFLPLDANGDVVWENLTEQLNGLRAAQVDGIYCNGTAGEFFNQSEAEFSRLAKVVAGYCEEHSIPFQIGASHCHPVETRNRLAIARALNPGAIQVILPEWVSLTWNEIREYILALVDVARPVPLVIYNPPNSRIELTPEQWGRLTNETDGIVGIKVLGGDLEWHEAMRDVSERLSVFVAGSRLATGIIHGCARGSYSNVACFSPAGATAWGYRMLDDPEQALKEEQQIQDALSEALQPIRGKYSHTAIDKALAQAGGWGLKSAQLRWPLASIPEAEICRISRILHQRLPFLL